MSRVCFDRRENARRLSRSTNSFARVRDCRAHFGMSWIAQISQRRREITWTNEQPIDALHGGDGVEIVQRGSRLDLQQQTDFLVGAMKIIFDAPKLVRAVS